MSDPAAGRRSDLRHIGDLGDRHMGREITVTITGADVTGTLVGIIPVRDTVRLTLIVGGARLFTPAYSVGDEVVVWRKEAAS